jgi:hypothetical protein
MLYAILCYNSEAVVSSWTQAEDDKVMAQLKVVHEKLEKAGKLGPTARLMGTKAATTLKKGHNPPLFVDGPYAETKEQFLGFYVVDVESLDEAKGIAIELEKANPGLGGYEIRPVSLFLPGGSVG